MMGRVRNAESFGRVAVLMGGDSAEREVSLMTGDRVLAALKRRGVDAVGVDAAESLLQTLIGGQFDRCWNALHGPGGEDGVVQGALECLGLPYTGSGVLGSALAMDKLRSKRVLRAVGLKTPAYMPVASVADLEHAAERLGLPLIVKPASQGSSIGMSKVVNSDEFADAAEAACRHGEAFAEEWITGREFTAAILGDNVLPLVRIEAGSSFYDYEAKYFSDATQYVCPCGLNEEIEASFALAALTAFKAIGASGWGRVDFLVNAANEPYFLEVNTIPGMTEHSLVPMAARESGIEFDELVWRILETSFQRSNQATLVGAAIR